jgi:hypothetical protein
VRPVFELISQIAGDVMPKLSNLNPFHFVNLRYLLIIVRFGPVLKVNENGNVEGNKYKVNH